MSTGDRLKIDILENQNIEGDFPVEADGTVSVPGIGVISAAGLSLRAFEDSLRDVAAQTITNPSVSVQIVQYRPFFILGDVAEAGVYPYAPDMTVLRAVAVAGGFGNNVTGDQISRAVAISQARKSQSDARINLVSTKVNLARLKAEKAMAEGFDYTPDAEDAALGDNLQVIIENAQTLFETRQDAFRTRLEKLEVTKKARSAEVDSYKDQILLQNERLETSQAELAEVRDAREQGIVSAARLTSAIQFEQGVRAQTLQIETLKRQSEVSQAEVESQIADLTVSRNADLDREIQSHHESIVALRARLHEDRNLLVETGAASRADRDFRFELRRDGADVPGPIELGTPVKPGDTLLVIQKIEG